MAISRMMAPSGYGTSSQFGSLRDIRKPPIPQGARQMPSNFNRSDPAMPAGVNPRRWEAIKRAQMRKPQPNGKGVKSTFTNTNVPNLGYPAGKPFDKFSGMQPTVQNSGSQTNQQFPQQIPMNRGRFFYSINQNMPMMNPYFTGRNLGTIDPNMFKRILPFLQQGRMF